MTEQEAPLRTVQAFHRFVAELPTLWRPGTNRWDLRFWSVDDQGRVERIRAEGLQVPDRNLHVDSAIFAAACWCRRFRPLAVILASETWNTQLEPDGYERMRRDLGGTPDLGKPDNRRLLTDRYGAKIDEGFIVYGEIAGGPPVFHGYRLEGERLAPRRPEGEKVNSKFEGIRAGTPRVLSYYTPTPVNP